MLVSTRRSRAVEKGRGESPPPVTQGKMHCFVCALTPLAESPDIDSKTTLLKL